MLEVVGGEEETISDLLGGLSHKKRLIIPEQPSEAGTRGEEPAMLCPAMRWDNSSTGPVNMRKWTGIVIMDSTIAVPE